MFLGQEVVAGDIRANNTNTREQLGQGSRIMLGAALMCNRLCDSREQSQRLTSEYRDLFQRHLLLETLGQRIDDFENDHHDGTESLRVQLYSGNFWNLAADKIYKMYLTYGRVLTEEEQSLLLQWYRIINPVRIMGRNKEWQTVCPLDVDQREAVLIAKCPFVRRKCYQNIPLRNALLDLVIIHPLSDSYPVSSRPA